MGLRYNPFTGSFDMTRSPGSYLDGEVAAYSDLPLDAAAAPLNSAWLVRAGSGLWLLTRKPAGIYIRTATGGTDRDADYTYAGVFPDVFSDAAFTVYSDGDSTKNLQLSLSGIDPATTRTLTVPNASGTLPLLETANTYTQNQTLDGADIEITDATKGVILKSANNTRYRLTVTNSGLPVFTALLLLLLAQLAPAQTIGMATDTNGTILTDRAAALTFTNALAWNDTTNAAITRTNLALGTTNNVQFRRLKMIAAGAGDNVDDATLWLDTSGTNKFASIRVSGTGGGAEKYNAYLTAGPAGLNVSAPSGFRVLNGGTANTGSVLFRVSSSGDATMNGTASAAPNQTASSGASLMTRDLSDARYSFSRWYDANDLISGAQTVGVNPLVTGNGSGHIVGATLVTVSNINTKFMLPVDYRVSGEVKVVSYWTDRGATNSGTNGDIAVWAFPFVVQPTTDTTTNGYVLGTTIKNTFTANYGGSGNSRFYVMEQTLNFATVTNISATNPMQLKWVEFQRRGADASDTSGDNIYLSGVHIYVP
jgi:hypothetical protein